ncbi:MAG: hypothetical protein V9E90_02235 [Saprospiraceae bacterium]
MLDLIKTIISLCVVVVIGIAIFMAFGFISTIIMFIVNNLMVIGIILVGCYYISNWIMEYLINKSDELKNLETNNPTAILVLQGLIIIALA